MSPSIASAVRPDRAELLEFLRTRHNATLATTRRNGRPQLSPVTVGLNRDDHLVVSTYPERAKARNARRDPRVSLCVMSEGWSDPYVQVDGTARVIEPPEAVEPLVEYFRCISGEHPDWDEYRAAMIRQGKCLIEITIDAWGPIARGGFPARVAAQTD
ncbi:MAG TPA: PPOX class F420-dependent oxidoreductase [Actinopolymorphaceae bacterium]